MAKFAKATKKAWRAKVLLYGDSAVGKTHAALTFPNPAVIDAEGSADLFVDRFDFEVSATKSVKDAQQLIGAVKSGEIACDTIVIDSLTSLYNTLLNAASIGREDGTMAPQDWGKVKRTFSRLIDETYYKLGKHVVCTAWSKPEYAKAGDIVNGREVKQNELVKMRDMPDCDKKVQHAFDLVFRMEGDPRKDGYAVCEKSRYKAIKQGDRFKAFSWKDLEPLFAGLAGDVDTSREIEDDAASKDAEELNRQPVRTAKPRTVQPANAGATAVPLKAIADKWDQAGLNVEDLAAWINDLYPDTIWTEDGKKRSKLTPEQTQVIWQKVVAMKNLHDENLKAHPPADEPKVDPEPQSQPDELPAQTAGGSEGEVAAEPEGIDAQMAAAGLEADARPALGF